ncbi:hypothetical protein KQI63_14410 [bacterium]|nr:hypothetical protein [bacterium]
MSAETTPPMDQDAQGRQKYLALNILILLGYNNAVSVEQAMRIGEIAQIAGDPDQTDGVSYPREEVLAAITSLVEEELIRINRSDFDSSNLVNYATGMHDDHTVYITPGGILFVKRLTEKAEQDEAQSRGGTADNS